VPVPLVVVNETDADVEETRVAVPMVGAEGRVVALVIPVVATEATDVPPVFVAVRVNVYAVLAVRPLIAIGLAVLLPLIVPPAGLVVTA